MDVKTEKNDHLSSNMEDYLEAIARLKKNKGVARVKDISRVMQVKNPSVSGALNILSRDGLVVHERYGYVDLTPAGKDVARKIQKRHDTLIKFLTEILNIKLEIAEEDACRMEHTISSETFEKLTKFIEFVETCPDGKRPEWLKTFDYYFRTGRRRICKVRQSQQKGKAAK